MRSPFPRIHHRLALNFYPSLAKAGKAKDKLIAEQLDKAWAKFSGAASSDDDVKCAVDLIVQREVQRAAKEGRAPDYSSYLVKDETFNILVAGHETTSTTLCWAMKMLTTHQDVQQRLRSELYAEFADAHALGSLPAGEDLAKKRFPYLDAVLEEILRLSGTGFTSIRVATVDTQVLGHIIPKGTDVFVMTQGASFTAPSFAVDESKRSTTSHDSKDKTGEWDPADIGRFLPERWLRSGDNGEVEFNARAGPSMPFGESSVLPYNCDTSGSLADINAGGGPRGCFGKSSPTPGNNAEALVPPPRVTSPQTDCILSIRSQAGRAGAQDHDRPHRLVLPPRADAASSVFQQGRGHHHSPAPAELRAPRACVMRIYGRMMERREEVGARSRAG